MGIFGKLKNIFYDVEEVEEPDENEEVKESVKVEEIPVFKREEKPKEEKEQPKKEEYSERELFQSKSTFNFPIFEDEEPVKQRTRSVEPRKETIYKAPEPTVKKEFKPSPVISPVYGILDKNYKKEEITVKKTDLNNTAEINNAYDKIRQKAYGNLEEELENTLTKMNEELITSAKELTSEIETLTKENKNSENIETLLGKIEDEKTITLQEAEEKYKNSNLDETISDNTLEHDLFNLIDSMYESKEE